MGVKKYAILFLILSCLNDKQIDSEISKIKDAICGNSKILTGDDVDACVKYVKSIQMHDRNDLKLTEDYLSQKHNELINELSEFAYYSTNLSDLCTKLEARSKKLFESAFSLQDDEALRSRLNKSFQSIDTPCDDNLSLLKKIEAVLIRLCVLILSIGTSEKFNRHKKAFWMSETQIKESLTKKCSSFFYIPEDSYGSDTKEDITPYYL